MTESAIETKIVNALLEHNWQSYKQNGLGKASRPDRLILGPNGEHGFIEVKKPGQVPTAMQMYELASLATRDHSVAVCIDIAGALGFINLISICRGPCTYFYWHEKEWAHIRAATSREWTRALAKFV